MVETKHTQNKPTLIKKYTNRRLYDTGRSSYVTLDDLCEMVKEGHDFAVKDIKSGKDITHSVLTQIILDQESKGENNLLPIGFLRNIISFYGDNMQHIVPGYLETTLDIFVKNQEQLREQMNKSFEDIGTQGLFSGTLSSIEELNRQNIEMFERAMKTFTPFSTENQENSKE